MNKFGTTKVAQVGWVQNKHADSLVTLALSMTEEVPRLIKVELIAEPSISLVDSIDTARVDVAMISVTRLCWMDPIIDFLTENRVLMMKRRLTGFAEWLLGIGCWHIVSYIGGLLGGCTFCASTPGK